MNPNGQSGRNSMGPHRIRIQNYHYSLSQRLGSGYSSSVYRGRNDLNGKTVAIKVINLHKLREREVEGFLMNQIKILQEIRHENIIRYVDALMTANNCYIITECCPEGDLASMVSKKGALKFDQAMKLVLELVGAIKYLHSNNIIHRDIKPCNILMHRNRVKLADFGFAVKTSSTTLKDGYKIGTPLYMSPEALFNKIYSTKSDIWSLGVTIYELLEGCPPWPSQNQQELKEAIKGDLKFSKLEREDIQSVISGCLQYDAEARLTIDEVVSRLEDAMGVKSRTDINIGQDKENNMQNNNNRDQPDEDQEAKKSIRSNYCILKWLINYARFSAKLLPKVIQLELATEQKDPLIEMTARCLHMTISKLHRIETQHHHIGLINYGQFKRTSRFSRIKTVTEQYHKKYLLMLSKLPYTYSLPQMLSLEIKPQFIENIEKLQLDKESSLKRLQVVEGLLVLAEANLQARNSHAMALAQLFNFEQLIDGFHSTPSRYDEAKIKQLAERRQSILEEIGRKSESVSTDSGK